MLGKWRIVQFSRWMAGFVENHRPSFFKKRNEMRVGNFEAPGFFSKKSSSAVDLGGHAQIAMDDARVPPIEERVLVGGIGERPPSGKHCHIYGVWCQTAPFGAKTVDCEKAGRAKSRARQMVAVFMMEVILKMGLPEFF